MSGLQKRSVALAGHRTSVRLEPAFWAQLDAGAAALNLPLAQLITQIDQARAPGQGLASALRLWALEYAKTGPYLPDGDGVNTGS